MNAPSTNRKISGPMKIWDSFYVVTLTVRIYVSFSGQSKMFERVAGQILYINISLSR